MSNIDLTAAIRLWVDMVGDSGESPTDGELHAFALAVESVIRGQIAQEIEVMIVAAGPYAGVVARKDAARIARGES